MKRFLDSFFLSPLRFAFLLMGLSFLFFAEYGTQLLEWGRLSDAEFALTMLFSIIAFLAWLIMSVSHYNSQRGENAAKNKS